MRARLHLALMPESDRQALLREAEHPESLPEGETVAPEITALEALSRSPMALLLDEAFTLARESTPEDAPVPVERMVYVIDLLGLAADRAALLPHLRDMDRAWRSTMAEHREQSIEEARTREGPNSP